MAGYIGSKSSVTLVDGITEEGGTLTGDLSFGDNDKAKFGVGNDLQVYHDGSNSYIDDAGTGNLYLRASNAIIMQSSDGAETIASFHDDNLCRLYYDNSVKLATTSTGIDVTGKVTSDELTVDSGVNTETRTLLVNNAHSGGSMYNAFGVYVGETDRKVTLSADYGESIMAFKTNGVERMTLNSSGKVGIGDSSPSARLEIGGMAAGEQALLIQSGRNDALSNGLARINITDSNCPFTGLQIDHAGTGSALVAIGKVAIGDTNPTRHGITTKALIVNTSTTTGDFALHVGRLTTGSENVVCISNGNGKVGSITTSGSSTAYNTSSDYRLKENVVDLTGASARVNQLNPSRFNWITDDTNTAIDGFLAHEVATVVPEAINGTKDAMMDEEYEVTPAVLDDDGNVTTEAVMGTRSVPDYQGIDQSKLVPLLTAALQEALTEIASLKTRVEALEA